MSDLRTSNRRQGPGTAKRRSLVSTVLWRVGLWSSLLVLVLAAMGYWLSYKNARQRALADVVSLAEQRGEAAVAPLREVASNAERFAQTFRQAYAQAPAAEVQRFERIYRPDAAGSYRLLPDYFHGTSNDAGMYVEGVTGFIGRDHARLDDEFKRRMVLLTDLVARFGPAWGVPVANTHVSLPENALIMYWPGQAWGLDARADLDVTAGSVVRATEPDENPEREAVWSPLYHDHTAGQWMITYQLPIDVDGRHLANASHDILLDEILAKLAVSAFPGSRTLLISEDGGLIGDLEHPANSMPARDIANVSNLQDPVPAQIYRYLQRHGGVDRAEVLRTQFDDHFVAVARIQGPDWYFIAMYPHERVAAVAHRAGWILLATGVLLQVILLLVLWVVMRRRIMQPLRQLDRAVSHIAKEDYAPVIDGRLPLPLQEHTEMGELGRTLRDMSRAVYLRQEELEALVRERTESLAQLNLELANLAQTDRLTGLPNRRALDDDLDALEGSARIERIAIGMLDIDHFKSFNDALGHAAGDDALREMGLLLGEQQRPDVRAYRYGGEEFCIIFTDRAAPHAKRILQKVLAHLRARSIVHPTSETGVVTVSAGLAECYAAARVRDCLISADKALFRAKRAGRDRLEVTELGEQGRLDAR